LNRINLLIKKIEAFNIKLLICLVLLACSLTSCYDKRINLNIQKGKYITIIDTVFLKGEKIIPKEESDILAFYPCFYTGKLKDTISLIQNIVFNKKMSTKPFFLESINFTRNLRIYVDTNLKLTYQHSIPIYDKEDKKNGVDLYRYSSYGMILFNDCDSFLNIGEDFMANKLVRQAKDDSGKWKNVEIKIDLFERNSTLYLSPKSIGIVKIQRYEGFDLRECRIKFESNHQVVYSNTFYDYIMEGFQFKLAAGNY
jgi:hypothetical protein